MNVIQLHKRKTSNIMDDMTQSTLEDEANVPYEDYINSLPIKDLDNYVHKVEIDSLNFNLLNPDTRKALIAIRNTNKKPR
ncbi:MAG: hypothetical protein QM500_04510 [Methylococcales bacterium]